MKNFIFVLIIVIILVGVGIYLFSQDFSNDIDVPSNENSDIDSTTTVPDIDIEPGDEDSQQDGDSAQGDEDKSETVIGTSAGGNDITAYHYGDGNTNLLFVGGLHGGYDWNTVLTAYELRDYLENDPNVIPENVRATVIPVLNPDGLEKVVGTTGRFTKGDVPVSQEATVPGRFNANGVDLNRNFDCDWQETGTWQNKTVDAGSAPFSEPESQAFRDYVNSTSPDGVVVWYSAAGGVFASNCHQGVLPETLEITNAYAEASGYPAYEEFNFYEITGDAVNWLAKKDIPAISVLLSNHEDTEWDKNRRGVEALFEYYAE